MGETICSVYSFRRCAYGHFVIIQVVIAPMIVPIIPMYAAKRLPLIWSAIKRRCHSCSARIYCGLLGLYSDCHFANSLSGSFARSRLSTDSNSPSVNFFNICSVAISTLFCMSLIYSPNLLIGRLTKTTYFYIICTLQDYLLRYLRVKVVLNRVCFSKFDTNISIWHAIAIFNSVK